LVAGRFCYQKVSEGKIRARDGGNGKRGRERPDGVLRHRQQQPRLPRQHRERLLIQLDAALERLHVEQLPDPLVFRPGFVGEEAAQVPAGRFAMREASEAPHQVESAVEHVGLQREFHRGAIIVVVVVGAGTVVHRKCQPEPGALDAELCPR